MLLCVIRHTQKILLPDWGDMENVDKFVEHVNGVASKYHAIEQQYDVVRQNVFNRLLALARDVDKFIDDIAVGMYMEFAGVSMFIKGDIEYSTDDASFYCHFFEELLGNCSFIPFSDVWAVKQCSFVVDGDIFDADIIVQYEMDYEFRNYHLRVNTDVALKYFVEPYNFTDIDRMNALVNYARTVFQLKNW